MAGIVRGSTARCFAPGSINRSRSISSFCALLLISAATSDARLRLGIVDIDVLRLGKSVLGRTEFTPQSIAFIKAVLEFLS